MPVQVYPMFETAMRAAAGETRRRAPCSGSASCGRGFSEVAAGNPYAWIRDGKDRRGDPHAVARATGWSASRTPKYMNSNNDVDMAAAVIMCSAEKASVARRARGPVGVRALRHRLPRAPVRQQPLVVRRDAGDRARRPPRARAGRRRHRRRRGSSTCTPASRPPCSSARRASGSSLDRQLTRTGGLPFAGGPWNNYVMHAIATVVDDLRERPGEHGLVWANGGYTTKHAFGVYSTDAAGGRVPPRLPAGRDRRAAAARAGRAGRRRRAGDDRGVHGDALPRAASRRPALAACLLADGRRAWGTSTDAGLAAAMCDGEWVGRRVDPRPRQAPSRPDTRGVRSDALRWAPNTPQALRAASPTPLDARSGQWRDEVRVGGGSVDAIDHEAGVLGERRARTVVNATAAASTLRLQLGGNRWHVRSPPPAGRGSAAGPAARRRSR